MPDIDETDIFYFIDVIAYSQKEEEHYIDELF